MKKVETLHQQRVRKEQQECSHQYSAIPIETAGPRRTAQCSKCNKMLNLGEVIELLLNDMNKRKGWELK